MKLDDRDIICEQDYTTLSNAELVAHIERYAGLMHSTPLSDGEWLDDILGPARVLLTRAEAAKVERNTTGRRAFNAEAENQRLAAENRRLAARVAELEAAQEWQSRSETPNAIDTYLVYRAAPPQNEPWRYDFAVWEDDGWDTEGFTHYRPLPPAPNVQEPTP